MSNRKIDEYHALPFEGRDVDLGELWRVTVEAKWLILIITFLCFSVSIVIAVTLPNIYKSEALLAPVEDAAASNLAGLAGQFGGLASLAGVSLGGSGDNTAFAIEVLKSRDFLTQFIDQRSLLKPLMAAKGWKAGSEDLIYDDEIYDQAKDTWVRDVSPPRKARPSLLEAYEEFGDLLNVSRDKESGFVRISIEFYSPFIAKKWVDWLIEDLNMALKIRDVEESLRSNEYLSEQLNKTSIADMHSIFYEIIEENTKTIMFAEVRKEYAFKTIDAAYVPEKKFSPKRGVIALLGGFVGVLISGLFVVCRYVFLHRE